MRSTHRRHLWVAVWTLIAIVLVGGAASRPSVALASGAYVRGSQGHDISWPQCDQPNPAIDLTRYGVVGINGGMPYTLNPCFGQQWRWASGGAVSPAIYVNLQFGTSLQAAGRPACKMADLNCQAFAYGWNASQYAFVTAYANTNGAAANATYWWLDVEVDNSWNDNPSLNSYVVAGAIAYLQDIQQVPVGVYSTAYMWGLLTAGYAPPGIANWVAGGANSEDYGMCAAPLWAGAEVVQFQWLDGNYDGNTGC